MCAGGHRSLRAVALTMWLMMAVVGSALAHDLERTTVHLGIAADGAFTLRVAHDPSWLLLRMETFAGGSSSSTSAGDPAVRDARLRALSPQIIDRVVLIVDGHEVRPTSATYTPPPEHVPAGEFALASYTMRGVLPASAKRLRWYYGMVADAYPFTLELADGTTGTEWVHGDAWSTALDLGGPFVVPSLVARLREYVGLGLSHILPNGLDHILFVVGLFLLRAQWAPVLAQVTTFTVAHSLTLALSLYGLIALPSRVVEPMIALSIVYVAVENVLRQTLTPWRIALVFGFGLLHGMGFAGVLTNLRLARGDFMVALFGFNLGVELGQLCVIATVAALVGRWRHRDWYRARIVVPASWAIAVVGAYWTLTRALG